VQVPQGPGLGIELDEAGMAEIMMRPWASQRG
jgi:L-alanine-DL-glutamate epimerase-like enolase superfamily enzyme